jgi:antitoxin component YwqK of YwqJK toxin-antitoxin module
MKRHTIIGLAIITCAGSALARGTCRLPNGEKIDAYSSSINEGVNATAVCKDDRGVITGKYVFKNGQKVEEHFYRDGRLYQILRTAYTANGNSRRHGLQEEFYDSGKHKSKENYLMNDRHGLALRLFENGKIEKRAHYAKGKELASVTYNEDGSTKFFSCSEDPTVAELEMFDRLCGFTGKPSEVTTYYKEGQRKYVYIYDEGRIAATKVYSTAGNVTKTTVKPTGTEVGVDILWHANGKKKQETRYHKAGYLHGAQREYDESGKLTREAVFESGFITKETLYYLNGQKKRLTSKRKKGEVVEVSSESYHDNGKVWETGEYIEIHEERYFGAGAFWDYNWLKPVGVHKEYREDGSLSSVERYQDGKLQGVSATYHSGGKIKKLEHTYEAGTLTREKRYDESGELVFHEEYFKDGSKKRHAVGH